MAKVTLIRPAYSAQVYGAVYKQASDSLREIRPPLGLMALAGYLKTFGHEVVIIDGEPDLLDAQDTINLTLATNPEFVGITSTTPEYPFAYEIIKGVKDTKPEIVTIFGGPHITNLPDHTMDDLDAIVDWGVVYEGEKPIAAIVNGHPEDYLWKQGTSNKLLMAAQRLTGEELEAFEPDREVLDMNKYKFVDTLMGMVQNDALEIARGCPFSCVFCTSRNTTLSRRSVESVLAEILRSASVNKTKLFMFFDDTFTLHKKHATELFSRIVWEKKNGNLPEDVHFYGFTRANTIYDKDFMSLLRDAGCDKITFGIETGNDEILRMAQKGTKKDDYRKAYNILDELGITKRGSFIIGHPYETQETIQDSIDFALELDLDEVGVNIMTPYPGQLTYRDALASKGIWFGHEIHYKELRENQPVNSTLGIRDQWGNFLSINWHDYWKDHLRWGRSVVETETLSEEALIYWHARFLQEVYGSENMAKRRLHQIVMGNDDDYWHRPWRTHSERNKDRLADELIHGLPKFAKPRHLQYTYDPIFLKDYQKNELVMPSKKNSLKLAS